MNWKFAFIFLVIFIITRMLLSHFAGWSITPATYVVGAIASLIFGYIERNR